MKKKLFFYFVSEVFLFIVFSSFKPPSDPVEYNNKILDIYTELDNQIAAFETALWDSTYTISELDREYKLVYGVYCANYDELISIETIKNDPGFHESVVDFYNGVKIALDNEYKQIMNMYLADEWEDVYYDKIYDLDDQVLDKLITLENIVIEKQEKFADIFDINLE